MSDPSELDAPPTPSGSQPTRASQSSQPSAAPSAPEPLQLSPLSAGEVALGSLLEASHTMHPDDIAAEVARRAAMIGAVGLTIWIVDRQQRVLTNLADPHGEHLDINSSMAGRCYRTVEVVVSEDADGPARVHVPLLDGSERLGVMTFEVRELDAITLTRCRQLAAVGAELFVSRRNMGDGPVLAQRVEDMDVAAEMRWSLMPPLTFSTPDVVVAGALEPAYEVAGDTFDYAANGDTLHFAVFDAMGHGLRAARMANLTVAAYRNARRRGLDLVSAMAFAQELLVDQFGEDSTFVTAHMGTLSLSTGRVRMLNAGHPRPLLLRGMRNIAEVECERGLPLGVGDAPDSVTELSLEPGDGLLFYSDGVTEARAADGEEFGEERLADMVVKVAASGETAPELMRRLTHAVLDHQDEGLDDDATLLLIRWRA